MAFLLAALLAVFVIPQAAGCTPLGTHALVAQDTGPPVLALDQAALATSEAPFPIVARAEASAPRSPQRHATPGTSEVVPSRIRLCRLKVEPLGARAPIPAVARNGVHAG